MIDAEAHFPVFFHAFALAFLAASRQDFGR
jgi:hypothetical protein